MSFASSIVNLSTRADVGVGNNVAIAGFITQGFGSATLVLRGIGPSLTPYFPQSFVLPNPLLELHNGNGTLLARNYDWKDSQYSQIAATGLAPTNDLESAILTSLAPGAYTVILSDTYGGTGIGLVEIYDISSQPGTAPLVNISTRASAENDDQTLIVGMIITGSGQKTLLLRGIGPSLPLSGTLPNPFLQLYNSTGGVIAQNDNWKDSQQSQIAATGAAPTNDLESAMIVTLNPGSYTATLQDLSGATGIASVEVYDLTPNPPPQHLVWNDTSGATVYAGYGQAPLEVRRTNVLTPQGPGTITVHWTAHAYGQIPGYLGPNISPSSTMYPQILDQAGHVLATGGVGNLTTSDRTYTYSYYNGSGNPFVVRIMVSSTADPSYNDQITLVRYDVYAP